MYIGYQIFNAGKVKHAKKEKIGKLALSSDIDSAVKL